MPADLAVAVPTRRRLTERRLVVLACALAYLGMALWFWSTDLLPGDAMSRIANGYYVLFSRDPHLAAIGFVWNPLPSLMLLPFLPLGLVFPPLTQEGLLAALASATLMTATVAVAYDVLRRTGLARVPRLMLTAALAAHPMTLLYAGNGMSEACFLLCLMVAVRALYRWLAEDRVELLVPLGLALALGYGARYEALAPAAAVTALVGLVTFLRTTGSRARRWALARTDAVVAGLPPVLAVLLWAMASKIIVDQWFATFSSIYGNSSQVGTNATYIASVTGDDLAGRTSYWLEQLIGLSPFALVLVAAGLVVAWRRRDARVLAPITVLGSVLAFDALAFLTGTSFGWLRFNITVVPMAVLLAGFVIARRPAATGVVPGTAPGVVPGTAPAGVVPRTAPAAPAPSAGAGPTSRPAPPGGSAVVRRIATVAVIVSALVAIPSTVAVLARPELSREESEWVTADGADRRRGLALVDRQVAADLDAMGLPEGAVVTDAAYAFGVVLASDSPRQFVITPDRDFAAVAGDPTRHGVRFLLLSAHGTADAVRIARYGNDKTAVPTTGVRTWSDPRGGLQWTLVPV